MKNYLLVTFFVVIGFSGVSQNIDSLQKHIQKAIETAIFLKSSNNLQGSVVIFIEIDSGSKIEFVTSKSDTIINEYIALMREELTKSEILRSYKGLKLIVPVFLLSGNEKDYHAEDDSVIVLFESIFKNAKPVIITKRIILLFSRIVK